MDLHHQSLQDQIAIYASIPVQQNDLIIQQRAKTDAFAMMDQLEGWCSKLKATMLMDLVFSLQPKVVVEIGVFGGKSFIPMAVALKAIGSGIIYGVDPWKSAASVVGMDKADLNWWGNIDHDKILNDLLKKISEFKLEHQISIVRATSKDAAPIQDIDLIHIDGNHSEEMSYLDVLKWMPLVRKGGVIIFDDLDWHTTGKAVKWLDEHCERVTQVRDTNIWGIWIKK